MTEVVCVAKRWGSSIGVVIPKEIVEHEHIKPDTMIKLSFTRLPLVRDVWNLGPVKETMSTQKIKDMMREGW